jgi:hypothetical protein
MSHEEFLERLHAHYRYPEKLDPELERMKNADFLTWARYFLPHYFPLRPSEMHLWLAHHLDQISTRHP